LKELAADKLEAAVDDLEVADGHIRIAGTDRAISYEEIAKIARRKAGETKSDRVFHAARRDLSQRHAYVRSRNRSGHRRRAHRALHGRRTTTVFTLNPLLLMGQVHGGIAQASARR